jgi:hypothetical protein
MGVFFILAMDTESITVQSMTPYSYYFLVANLIPARR